MTHSRRTLYLYMITTIFLFNLWFFFLSVVQCIKLYVCLTDISSTQWKIHYHYFSVFWCTLLLCYVMWIFTLVWHLQQSFSDWHMANSNTWNILEIGIFFQWPFCALMWHIVNSHFYENFTTWLRFVSSFSSYCSELLRSDVFRWCMTNSHS